MKDSKLPVTPWWRVGMMLLVMGGPAVVVVASVVTGVIAWRYGDVPLNLANPPHADTMVPADHARNHAATPR